MLLILLSYQYIYIYHIISYIIYHISYIIYHVLHDTVYRYSIVCFFIFFMDLDISEPEWVSRLKRKHQNVSDVLSLTDTPFERRDYRSPCAHGTKVLGIFHSSICRRALDDILQWAQIVGMGTESLRNTLWLGTGIHMYIYIYTYIMIYNSVSVVLPKICWSCSCCPNNPIDAAVFGDSWLGHRLGLEFFKGSRNSCRIGALSTQRLELSVWRSKRTMPLRELLHLKIKRSKMWEIKLWHLLIFVG